MQATRRAALVFAAVPVSTYLANLVPWWRAGHPLPGLVLSLLVAVLAVTAVAQLGPWRREPPRAFRGGGTATGLVLLVDVVTGSTLQLSSLMGYSPLVAGRFYGFGNLAFSLFATGMLLGVTAVADVLIRNGQRRAAVAVGGRHRGGCGDRRRLAPMGQRLRWRARARAGLRGARPAGRRCAGLVVARGLIAVAAAATIARGRLPRLAQPAR